MTNAGKSTPVASQTDAREITGRVGQDRLPEIKRRAREILDLARTDIRAAEAAFSSLAPEEQAELAAAAPPADRVRMLLLAEDLEDVVPKLPAMALHEAVMHTGKWESLEIIEHASAEQLNFMLDHDCWRMEKLESRKFTDWLRLIMSCDDQQVFRLITAINVDLLAYYLKKQVRFRHDIMIDDKYYCDPDWVTSSNATVREFLERLYALDPNLWIRLLGWIRTHSRKTMEADAVAGREARLKGRGIPPPSLAITIYYPVPEDWESVLRRWIEEFRQAFGESDRSGLPDVPEREAIFLARVVQKGAASDEFFRVRSEAYLVDVANKIIIADNIDIGDLSARRRALDKARRWTNVGLEFAAKGSTAVGLELLKAKGMEYWFRLGATLFDALANAAVNLQKLGRQGEVHMLQSPFGRAYLALIEPEPRIPAQNGSGTSRAIVTLAEYKYAWRLAWMLAEYTGVGAEHITFTGSARTCAGTRSAAQ